MISLTMVISRPIFLCLQIQLQVGIPSKTSSTWNELHPQHLAYVPISNILPVTFDNASPIPSSKTKIGAQPKPYATYSCPLYLDFVPVVSRFFRKFISSASKYRHQMYGFSSSAGCSISILNRCSMSI